MSEKLRYSGAEQIKQSSVLQTLREKVNLRAAVIITSIMSVVACSKDKEVSETPNQAPTLGVSVKNVSTTNFELNIDYTDDKEGGMVDYIVKDKSTGEQIADGQISADKKTLYIGGLRPEQSYQTNLEATDSDGKETPKSIDVNTSALTVEQIEPPTIDITILNIIENSTEPVQIVLTSQANVNNVTVTGETANYLDLQSVERIGTTDDYTITLKPHDLDWDTDPEHLGGLEVETDDTTSELTLNVVLGNENEPTPTLFGDEENQRGTEGKYFVFKLEDSALIQFYTHGEELMDEDEVETAVNETGAFTGSMTAMLGTMNLHDVLPKHANGVTYLTTQGSEIVFQDENEMVIKDIDYDLFRNLFAYMRDRIQEENLEDFSESGWSATTYFSGALSGNICEGFSTELLTKLYTDYADTDNPIAPEFIAKFVTEKRLYNSIETE